MRLRLTAGRRPLRTLALVAGLFAALVAFPATVTGADSLKPVDYTTVTGLSKAVYTSDQIVRDILDVPVPDANELDGQLNLHVEVVRRIYYPFMILLAIVISIIIFQSLPTTLVSWAANMSNLAALIMPLALMYLISRLPRPARAAPWSYVVLSCAVVFFGYFFINFFSNEVFGTDLSFW